MNHAAGEGRAWGVCLAEGLACGGRSVRVVYRAVCGTNGCPTARSQKQLARAHGMGASCGAASCPMDLRRMIGRCYRQATRERRRTNVIQIFETTYFSHGISQYRTYVSQRGARFAST